MGVACVRNLTEQAREEMRFLPWVLPWWTLAYKPNRPSPSPNLCTERWVLTSTHQSQARHTLCPLFPNTRLCPQAPSPLLKQTAADLFSIAGVSFSSSGIRSKCKHSLHSLESSPFHLEWCFGLTGVVACIHSSFLYLLPCTCMYTLMCSTFQVYN